jgi:glutamine amidotransferase
MTVALIDYGAGNLTSVRKGFAAAGEHVFTPSDPRELLDARAIVVPGVGHFQATRALEPSWRHSIAAAVKRGVPLLGICLGLQWLFEGSDEAPDVPGLGALTGRCTRLPDTLKVPHVGWNSLEIIARSALLEGLDEGTQVYFTHAFAAPVTSACVAATTHSCRFAAAVESNGVYGVQFHPEKSGQAGIRILTNFLQLVSSPTTPPCSRSA